jgi:hypothetical protein
VNKRRGGLRPPATRKQPGARRAPLPAEKSLLERQIDAMDAAIDRLVYDLYGLTAKEIALVEETNA